MKKDVYFYWGNETMSYMRYMTLHSFCKFNPDWKVYLIRNTQPNDRALVNTIEKQDKTEYQGPDYTYMLRYIEIETIEFTNDMIDLDDDVVGRMSDVHIKDILNWKLLSESGGVVADMDILFTKPIGNVIKSETDIGLVCFEKFPQKDYIPVSFMYSSGENKFFKKVYENALSSYNSEIYESCGTLCIEEKNLREIKKKYPESNVQRLPDAVVFPFVDYEWNQGIRMLYNGDHVDKLHEQSIGIHWYGGAPLSQIYNNVVSPARLQDNKNTITEAIRRIL